MKKRNDTINNQRKKNILLKQITTYVKKSLDPVITQINVEFKIIVIIKANKELQHIVCEI